MDIKKYLKIITICMTLIPTKGLLASQKHTRYNSSTNILNYFNKLRMRGFNGSTFLPAKKTIGIFGGLLALSIGGYYFYKYLWKPTKTQPSKQPQRRRSSSEEEDDKITHDVTKEEPKPLPTLETEKEKENKEIIEKARTKAQQAAKIFYYPRIRKLGQIGESIKPFDKINEFCASGGLVSPNRTHPPVKVKKNFKGYGQDRLSVHCYYKQENMPAHAVFNVADGTLEGFITQTISTALYPWTFVEEYRAEASKNNSIEIDICKVISATFKNLNDVACAALLSKEQNSVSTLTSCLVINDELYIANVGDSAAVIAEQESDKKSLKATTMSENHRWGTDFEQITPEREAAINKGATTCTTNYMSPKEMADGSAQGDFVHVGGSWRLKTNSGFVKLSRMMGGLSPYASAVPAIKKIKINDKTKFLILASDGLWDNLSEQEAVNLMYDTLQEEPGNYKKAANVLISTASKNPKKLDDIAVTIVDLHACVKTLKTLNP